MAVRTKIGAIGGGSWRDVPTGALRVRSGGAWVGANKCRVKIGGVGGGYWYDSGYIGYPNAPQSFGIPAWDFANVATTWAAPAAGGAPVSYYQVVKTDAAGNWYGGFPVNVPGGAGATGYTFSVVEDERSQLYVRSISAAGLASGWAGPLRVQIGHTQITHPSTATRIDDWHSIGSGPTETSPVNLYLDNYIMAIGVPSNVVMTSWYISLMNNEAPAWDHWTYLSPGTTKVRNMVYFQAGVPQWGSVITAPNPWGSGWIAPYNGVNGGGAEWGFAIDGLGYSKYADGPYRIHGFMQIWGKATVTYPITVVDRTRVENVTW